MADALIQQTGYFGIFLVLVLGGLGLPVPEEAPIIIAAVLAKKGAMHWAPALTSCFAGVLVGDFIVYFLGFFYGEKVLSLPLTRKFLTRAREAQIKGYFHRHGVKILILGRFAVGFRTAAYLTAGILRLPTLKLFVTDLCAASFSTFLMFGLGYAFAAKFEEGLHEAQHYVAPALALGLGFWLLHRFVKARLKAGQPVGPPVLVEEDIPLPPDDLHAEAAAAHAPAGTPPAPGRPPEPIAVAGPGPQFVGEPRPAPALAPTPCPASSRPEAEAEAEPVAAASAPALAESEPG